METDMTTSRSLVSVMQVTLDGHILDPAGEVDWVDSWADGVELIGSVDAFVLGGGMFPQYEQFWQAILDDPDAAAAMLGRDPYPREVTYAHVARATPHLVLSGTLTEAAWPSARITRDIDEIRELRLQPGKNVYVVGGPGLLTSLIDAGLLDELHLIVHPVATGGGTGVFGTFAQRQSLELVSAEPMTSGRVHLAYLLPADGTEERAQVSEKRGSRVNRAAWMRSRDSNREHKTERAKGTSGDTSKSATQIPRCQQAMTHCSSPKTVK